MTYIKATSVFVDEDEGRFVLLVWDEDGEKHTIDIHDDVLPFYGQVQREIRPWFLEAEHARQAVRAGMSRADYLDTPQPVSSRPVSVEDAVDAGYALDDPKHPAWHSTHADLWDAREGK